MSEEKLSNKYRDNIKVDELREGISALRREIDAIKVDLTSFYGAMFQSGIIELVKDEEDNVVNKINKVVLVDESVQQD